MKKLLSLLLAGFVGGIVAFFSFQQFANPTQLIQAENKSPRVVLASNETPVLPYNFVEAAQRATPAVVHVMAKESDALAQQRYEKQRRRSPLDGFFNFGDMDDFFGRNFYSPRNGTGSGVIISENGYIVTNNHVVEYADIITVVLSDDRKFEAVKIGTDPSTDIALLKIEGNNLNAIEFGDSDKVQVGQWVAAVGNPFSYLMSTVTAGIVSAKGRDLDIIQGEKTIEEFIQTDAVINPGNSGGALVTPDGKLVGLNTAIATPTGVYAGYSFAIPSNLVKTIVEEIKENGNIERARLGVLGNTVDEAIIKENNLGVDYGFFISRVEKGSAAQFSGVLPGDVIIRANGKGISNYEDLADVLEFAKVGDTVKLSVIRKNKEVDIPVKMRKGI
jgi:S1-C subfamily serine protease